MLSGIVQICGQLGYIVIMMDIDESMLKKAMRLRLAKTKKEFYDYYL